MMYKRVVFVFSCICFLNHLVNAESTVFCKAAKDSMSVQFSRGEMAFFLPSKNNPNLFSFIKIDKNHYEKKPIRISSPTNKDTTKSMSKKLLDDYYKSKMGTSQPFDTSSEYKKCYNQAFQPKLDSAFKCDFFRKADSILKVYDKTGKGYSNVEFPGGAVELQKFLDKNITLPKDVKQNDSDKVVRIYYAFLVDEKGAISDIKLVKSNCKDCEAAVLDGIHKLPTFIPATDAGKPKKINYILPYTKNLGKPSLIKIPIAPKGK